MTSLSLTLSSGIPAIFTPSKFCCLGVKHCSLTPVMDLVGVLSTNDN